MYKHPLNGFGGSSLEPLPFDPTQGPVFDAHPVIDAMLRPAAPAVPSRTPTEQLAAVPQSGERDTLIAEHFALSRRIESFLAEHRSQRVGELEAKRHEAWATCRRFEDRQSALTEQIAQDQNTCNALAFEVNGVRERARELQRPPFTTNFPNEAELGNWHTRKHTAQREREALETQLADKRRFIISAQNELRDVGAKLREAVEQLRAVDGELNKLKH